MFSRLSSSFPSLQTLLKDEKPDAEDQHAAICELRRLLGAGVQQQLLQGGEEGLTDATLLRWLAARKWHVAKAAAFLRQHAHWRSSFVPEGRIPEASVAGVLSHQKVFIQGKDKQGRPVIYVRPARHVSPGDVEEHRRLMVYVMDIALEMDAASGNPAGKIAVIHDMTGYGRANMDPPVARVIIDTLQNHYPERLGVFYLYNPPTVFWLLWKIVSPFIDANTYEKIKFVYPKDAAELFPQTFDMATLPAGLGGTGKEVPVQEVRQRLVEQQQQQQQQQQQEPPSAFVRVVSGHAK